MIFSGKAAGSHSGATLAEGNSALCAMAHENACARSRCQVMIWKLSLLTRILFACDFRKYLPGRPSRSATFSPASHPAHPGDSGDDFFRQGGRTATAAQRWPRTTPPYAQWPMKTPVRARVVRIQGGTAILKAFSVCFCGEFHSVKAPETRSKYALQKQGHGMDFSHRRALAHGRALR